MARMKHKRLPKISKTKNKEVAVNEDGRIV